MQGAGTPQSYTQGPYQTEEPVEQYFNYQQNIKMSFIFQLSTQYQNFDHISLINTKISIMMSISRLSSQQYDQSMTCQCQHQVPNIYNNNIINRDYPVEDTSEVQKKAPTLSELHSDTNIEIILESVSTPLPIFMTNENQYSQE